MFRKNALSATLMVVMALLVAACGLAIADTPAGSPDTSQQTDRSSESFVGLSVDEAGARAQEQGRPWRIIREDGVDLAVTEDFSEDRLNFTVEDGTVVAAVTDADMISGDTTSGSCSSGEPPIDKGEIIGSFDINADGREEIVAMIDADADLASFAIWTWDDDCSLQRVTIDGVPALLLAGLTETTAAGISCNDAYVDDVYLIDLTSNDGDTYEGRIAAFDLMGSELVEVSGEGAAYSRADLAAVATLSCGEITYP